MQDRSFALFICCQIVVGVALLTSSRIAPQSPQAPAIEPAPAVAPADPNTPALSRLLLQPPAKFLSAYPDLPYRDAQEVYTLLAVLDAARVQARTLAALEGRVRALEPSPEVVTVEMPEPVEANQPAK